MSEEAAGVAPAAPDAAPAEEEATAETGAPADASAADAPAAGADAAASAPTEGGADEDEEDVDAELEAMKQRLKEMEDEAASKKAAAPAPSAAPAPARPAAPAAIPVANAESDARSVYVGNVDYAATPEELQAHFADCGTINRVTIMCNKATGVPKGFAYIEFVDEDAVKNAVILNEAPFRNRPLKVTAKRTNVPGMNYRGRGGFRGRGRGRGRGRARGRWVPY